MSRPSGGRLASLDWIRGAAATAVVLYHAEIASHSYLLNLAAPAPEPWAWFGSGWIGVPVFFALSGDVIARSIQARPQNSLRFLVRRFWRLYPTYVVLSLLFIALLVFLPQDVFRSERLTGSKVLSSFVFGWGRMESAYLYVGWTLFWEVGFYLIAAPFAPGRWRLPQSLSLLAFPSLSLLALLLSAGTPHGQAITFVSCFGAGVAAFALPGILRLRGRRPRRLAVGLVAYVLGLVCLALNPYGGGFGLMAALSSLLLVLAVVLEQRRPGLFRHPLPAWLGRISYSLYLVQTFTVPAATKAVALLVSTSGLVSDLPFGLLNALAITLSVLVTVLAGWLSWRLLEVGFTRWLEQGCRRVLSPA